MSLIETNTTKSELCGSADHVQDHSNIVVAGSNSLHSIYLQHNFNRDIFKVITTEGFQEELVRFEVDRNELLDQLSYISSAMSKCHVYSAIPSETSECTRVYAAASSSCISSSVLSRSSCLDSWTRVIPTRTTF